MTGVVYFQASGGQDGVQNVYGAMFFFVSATSYLQIYSVGFVSIDDITQNTTRLEGVSSH